jgi:hypothetical protein
MRCQYCGSTTIHPDTQHKQFATGKAVAGAVTFGLVGAAAGFIGKDTHGYSCGACGAFSEKPMDYAAESAIDGAIRDAEAGRSRDLFDYFKKQYPNIQANIPQAAVKASPAPAAQRAIPEAVQSAEPSLKRICKSPAWQPDCPVYVEAVLIKSGDKGDVLSLRAYNQSNQELRSVYYTAITYDDTGDKIGEVPCVYQNVQTPAGAMLPTDQSFPLGTNLAYQVELICEKASMAGDNVWRSSGQPGITLQPQPQLTEKTFPRFKYLRSEFAGKCRRTVDFPLYLPKEGDGYWQCICGQPVKAGAKCPHCGAELQQIMPLLSQQHLQQVQLAAVKQRAAKRAGVTMRLYEKAQQQANEKVYQAGIEAQSKDDISLLNEAIEKFESIPDYKDSQNRAEDCKKKIAEIEQEQKEKAEEHAERERQEQAAAATQKKVDNWVIAIIITVIVAITCFVIVKNVVIP